MTVSIVIPVYNGAATIGGLVDRLIGVLGADGLQIVLVNDGSPDDSHAVCLGINARFPDVVSYIDLSKNFGEHNAVMAGLHYARGDYVVIMDDDCQNPPEEVPRLVKHAAEQDADVVYTYYARKRHHWLRNLGSRINDAVANWMLGKPRDLYLSSFKCLSRFVVGEVLKYTGPYPYLDGLILRCTRRISKIEVRHEARRQGRSGYTFRKLMRLWLNMFVNFSVMPLRVSTITGFVFSFIGLVLGVWVVVDKLTHPDIPIGWASTVVLLLIFSGVQLVMLGLVGEYLGRLFLSINQTPQFVVRQAREWRGLPCPTHPSSTSASPEPGSSSPAAWVSSAATSPSASSPSAPG